MTGSLILLTTDFPSLCGCQACEQQTHCGGSETSEVALVHGLARTNVFIVLAQWATVGGVHVIRNAHVSRVRGGITFRKPNHLIDGFDNDARPPIESRQCSLLKFAKKNLLGRHVMMTRGPLFHPLIDHDHTSSLYVTVCVRELWPIMFLCRLHQSSMVTAYPRVNFAKSRVHIINAGRLD